MNIIHRDLTIDEVLALVPGAENILNNYALSCSSCFASGFEKLGDGILGHGYGEETLEAVIRDLNAMMSGYQAAIKRIGIYITDEAIAQLEYFAEEDNKSDWGLKIERSFDETLEKYSYGLDFQENEGDDEYTIAYNENWNVFVSMKDMDAIQGLLIDFIDNEEGMGFKLLNPNDHK